MSLSKSKCLYSNNYYIFQSALFYLNFAKCIVPLGFSVEAPSGALNMVQLLGQVSTNDFGRCHFDEFHSDKFHCNKCHADECHYDKC